MKAHNVSIWFVLPLLLFCFTNTNFGQTNPPIECGFPSYEGEWEMGGEVEEEITAIQRGGKWMSAKDTLNVLVVFVQFPDDRYDTTYSLWPTQPLNQTYTAPSYINTFIDSLPSQMSSDGNLTHYFRVMSNTTLKLTGKTRFAVTPHSRQWYLDNGWHRWLINKEVLETLDVALDYSQFDRWRRYGAYDIRREADDWVGMVFMIYRNVSKEYGTTPYDTASAIRNQLRFAGGEASLGYAGGGDPTSFYVDNGQRRIGHGHPVFGHPGSGFTTEIGGAGDGWFGLAPYRVSIHELAHHWMTDGPDYGHNGAGFWAVLNHYLFRHNAASVGCVNSFERELLGWHYPDSIGTSGGSWTNLTLTDFISTNKSYKIKVPGSNPDEYFRLEYHLRVSEFDTPEMHDASAKGLYIIHQSSVSNPRDDIRLQPADGRWTWTTLEVGYVSWYPNPLPIFRKTGIDRVNGYDDSRQVPFTWPIPPYTSSAMEIILWRDRATNEIIEKPLIRGDGNDAFRLDKNTVFSPWSNPNSQNIAKQKTWIAIEIVNEASGVVTFNLHIDSTNCLQTSPSKPQDLLGSVFIDEYTYRHPRLGWAVMQEPDVLNGGNILVHRRTKIQSSTWSSWSLFATLPGDSTGYTDMSISTAGLGTTDSVQYRIQAKDNSTKVSVYSDVVSMTVGTDMWKVASDKEGKPETFALGQNFPNPFNPSTMMKYQLAEDGFAELQVFDILGREVATIARGFQPAGYYSATFNADKLASGVYFVRFTVNNEIGRAVFTKMSKMALVR